MGILHISPRLLLAIAFDEMHNRFAIMKKLLHLVNAYVVRRHPPKRFFSAIGSANPHTH
jgi:hypothetical protein